MNDGTAGIKTYIRSRETTPVGVVVAVKRKNSSIMCVYIRVYVYYYKPEQIFKANMLRHYYFLLFDLLLLQKEC
jgi:hypothetical protein